jgi:hypothetical protein
MSNTGGPAFPYEYKYGDGTAHRCDGMTLRDYLAAKALVSLATYEEYPPELVAKYAYEYADAMLKAREEK